MATLTKSTVNSITQFNVTGASLAASGTHSIFTASSTSNVITQISGRMLIQSSTGSPVPGGQIVVGPVSAADPDNNAGSWWIYQQIVNHRTTGTTVSTPFIASTSIMQQGFSLISFASQAGGSNMVNFQDFVIPPGYFFYLRNAGATAALYSYQISRIEISQG